MKKKYFFIILIVISSIVISFFIKNDKTESYKGTVEFTPKELWNIEFKNKKEKRKIGYNKADKPDMFTKYFKEITTKIGDYKSNYSMNYKMVEYNKALENARLLKTTGSKLSWEQRGPANIGGRTRAVVVDPDDNTNNTWFAGAATGGIWKTTDGGDTWSNLSENFTNLSVNALAMSSSNTDVLYAGTGESFPGGTYLKGNGIWKSIDRGISWTQLSSTSTDENFAYINRLIINPDNEDVVLAATEKGIFKTISGGTSWTKVYSSNLGVEDLAADPTNFTVLFAGENSVGVVRSTNSGDTWEVSSNGIGQGKRFEIAVSPVDNNYVYTSVEISTTESVVYFSNDNGLTWKKFNNTTNLLGGQGGYDNAITAHPYIKDEVFLAGVDMWKLKFNGAETTSNPQTLSVYTQNTSFLSFINFGGAYLGGGISDEDGADLVAGDWVSIEVRFGTGISQKAHRFTVPVDATSGVSRYNYTYIDYIDVPFQVWDITNNKQLMVSFRDQEQDGKFNLYERTGEEAGELGREYIYINAVEYNANTPAVDIAKSGGQLYKSLYMIWPTLAEGEEWKPNELPNSKIVINYGVITLVAGDRTSIADSYGNYGGPNGYDQGAGFGETSIPGLHPDHHNITIIPTGDPNFIMIDANDGGFGISNNNGVTITQIPNNYITTQFYGVAKHPNKNEYIGGMQDNGTWQSASGEDASVSSDYLFRIGGDGFECLWNSADPSLMLGSVYNNSIRRSNNGGTTWAGVSGITSNDGPFITRLSASKENPDLVFAVGNSGVYKSSNFGLTWGKKNISTNWAKDNSVSSSHNVEVSLANGKNVWAGGGMAKDYGLQIQVSTDYGETFTALNDFDDVSLNAYISGIATHPSQENTAYILFSLSDKPKILRTTDLGQTWTDISGFGTGDESVNGFPDVVTHCLLVMPHNPNTIWVGTDIGLFESTDNGASWHIANNGLPNVSVYDMHISGNQVVVATHGRGVWTLDIEDIDNSTYISSFSSYGVDTVKVTSDFKVAYDSVEVYLNNVIDTTLQMPSADLHEIVMDTENLDSFSAHIIGYISTVSYTSNTIYLSTSGIHEILNNYKDFKVYPNPSSGLFFFDVDDVITNCNVYNILGKNVTSISNVMNNSVDLSYLSEGSYILHMSSNKNKFVKLIQIKK